MSDENKNSEKFNPIVEQLRDKNNPPELLVEVFGFDDFAYDGAFKYTDSKVHSISGQPLRENHQKIYRKNEFHQKSSLQSIKDIFCRENASHHIANTQFIPELNNLQWYRINFQPGDIIPPAPCRIDTHPTQIIDFAC